MRELHTHSLVFYQAGHQAFSQIMEGLVADELVVFDEGVFLLTECVLGDLESAVHVAPKGRGEEESD